jgi:hypothetical protein
MERTSELWAQKEVSTRGTVAALTPAYFSRLANHSA